MKVKDATRKPPVTVGTDSMVSEVAALMDQRSVGAVVVLDGERPVGIVTDRDLVLRVLARRIPEDSRVDAVMSGDLVTISSDADLRDAIGLFSERPIRRLPLVEQGRLVGMLTVDDLLIDVVGDLGSLLRPVTGQVIFAHPEAQVPAERF